MKRKSKLAPRNPLVATSKFRKAGPHDKAFKAKRRADKTHLQRVVSLKVEQWTFNPSARVRFPHDPPFTKVQTHAAVVGRNRLHFQFHVTHHGVRPDC